MLANITRLFPLWAILLSVLAYFTPGLFLPIGPWVSELLMLIMFAMGVTLSIDDFKRVITRPAPGPGGRNDPGRQCGQWYRLECHDLSCQR